jgi:two-component system, OmpR family, sensor kinase
VTASDATQRLASGLASRPAAWRDRVLSYLHGWPLTWRLLVVVAGLLVAAMSATTLATTMLMRAYLMDRTREELSVASIPIVDRIGDQLAINSNTVTGVPATYAVAIYLGGRVATVSALDERYQPQFPMALSLDDPRVTSGQPFTVRSTIGDVMWLVQAGRLSGGQGTFAVAASMRPVDATIDQMRAVSIGIGLAVVSAGAGAGWVAIRRAFRPLRTIEDTAAAIAAGDLTRRVPEHIAEDEVASLSRSLNVMLAHLETSFSVREASEERMRRFVTDASHELRTPLATVRGYAELYRQGAASSPEATAAAMRRIEEEARRMSGLVEDLLTLARLDNRRSNALSRVDLTVLASDAVADARVRDPARSVRLMGLPGRPIVPTVVRGDEARLRQVVANLVSNALAHTPAGTPVEVSVGVGVGEAGGDVARIIVADHGEGIAEETAARVFERFYRGDPARGRREEGGHGLGLAIVAAIVEAHRGRVGVGGTPGGGATFIVDIPLTADADDESLDDDDTDDFDDSAEFDDRADSDDRADGLGEPRATDDLDRPPPDARGTLDATT